MNGKIMFRLLLKLLFYSNLNVNNPWPVHRHFFISEGYYTCEKGLGWVVVIDGIGPCRMDKANRTTVYYVDTHSYSLMPGGKIYKIKTHLCWQLVDRIKKYFFIIVSWKNPLRKKFLSIILISVYIHEHYHICVDIKHSLLFMRFI